MHSVPPAALALALMLLGCVREQPVITTHEEAGTARIGVMTGTTGEQIAGTRFPDASIQQFDDIMMAVAALDAGQLDAIVTSWPAAFQIAKTNPRLRVLPGRLSDEPSAVAAQRANATLIAAVNGAIAGLQQDGTLADMKARWFKAGTGPYDEPTLTLPATGPPLRVGVSATREPVQFVDQAGRVTGHDGELARRLAIALGRPIEFLDMKFMALIPALESGKIDLIVAGMTATPERAKRVAFSTSYFENAQVMLARAPARAEAVRASALQDYRTGRIGVLEGSAHEAWATREMREASILQYQGGPDLILAVKTRKVDAALYDSLPLAEVMREDPAIGVLGAPLFKFDVGVGFRSGNEALRLAFNRFLGDLKADGTYDRMVKRWVTEHGAEMPTLPPTGGRGTLVVGTSSSGGLPFGAVQNGQLVGLDVELVERFAASQGKRIEWSDMVFGSLVAAVATGKVDLIISSIYITPEREERIDFGDPYFAMETMAFGLKANIAGYEADSASVDGPGFWAGVKESFEANLIKEGRWRLIVDGLRITALIAILATLVGTGLGALVCAMRMSHRTLLSMPARVFISVLRGTPVLVLLMLVFYVVFASVNIDPVLVAVIAFALNFAAYVSEIFRTGIEGVDRGQGEAGLAMGFSRTQTFRFIVLPQTIRRILPVYKGEFISLVKMTSIVGYIAVQDLTKASDIIRSRTFDAFFPIVMVAILYFAISWLLGQALDALERQTDPRRRLRHVRGA